MFLTSTQQPTRHGNKQSSACCCSKREDTVYLLNISLFLLSFDFSSTTLALAVVCLRGWPSGGFGTATRRSLQRFILFWWYGATTVLFLPVTRQEITDGSFNAWTETVVHLWVHDLCDDSVHTRLQHPRSGSNTKGKKRLVTQVLLTCTRRTVLLKKLTGQRFASGRSSSDSCW